jgi:hypothetical protein
MRAPEEARAGKVETDTETTGKDPADGVARAPGNAHSTGAFPEERQNLNLAPSIKRRGVSGSSG